MATQQWCASRRNRALLTFVVVVATTIGGSRSVAAQIQDAEVAADSELQLLERADGGEYQRYSITIITHEGRSSLTTNKDGNAATRELPVAEAVSLWRDLLTHNVDTLQNAAPERTDPDSSRFALKWRVGVSAGDFSAVGVDSLTDTRYRAIVRAVQAFAARQR